jgi:hypothetical protein
MSACEPTVTVGDSAEAFTATKGQIEGKFDQAKTSSTTGAQ